MKRSVVVLAAAVTAGLLALIPSEGLAQDFSVANAINNRGDFVGGSLLDSQTQFGTLGGSFSVAFGINDRGDIVGQAETTTGDVHAFLFRRNVMIDVDNRIPH